MLGALGAALIILAVTHVVTVVCLACRPQAGPAFAVLTTAAGPVPNVCLDSPRCRLVPRRR
jgi:hypothetical protein